MDIYRGIFGAHCTVGKDSILVGMSNGKRFQMSRRIIIFSCSMVQQFKKEELLQWAYEDARSFETSVNVYQ